MAKHFDPVQVRRNALVGRDEARMTQKEIADAMIAFYGNIAEKHGGAVSVCFIDVFVGLFPDGTRREERDARPAVLTADVHDPVNPYFPLLSICIPNVTGKYGSEQTAEEEMKELRPYREALERLLGL